MRVSVVLPLAFGLSAFAQTMIHQQHPNLIVPLDERTPDKPLGTQKIAYVEHAVHTEISFDVPDINAKYCRLSFSLNSDPKLNPPRNLWGVAPFRFNISSIERTMSEKKDTWNSHPKIEDFVGQVEVTHQGGFNNTEMGVPCYNGTVAQYVLYPDDPNRDFGFNWYQLDYTPPHGLVYQMFVA